MSLLGIILLVVLVLLLVGAAPQFGGRYHNAGWAPSGGIGIVLIIVLLVLIFR